MKNILRTLLIISFTFLMSCKSTLVSPVKPLNTETFELGKKYEVRKKDATTYKLQITSLDEKSIVGIDKNGNKVEINKNEIREVKKVKYLASVVVAVIAIAAVIFVPI